MASASSSSLAQSVRVALRVRPFLPSEEAASGGTPCVSLVEGYPGGEVTVQLKDQHTSRCDHYILDAFFGQENNVSEIFDREVRALIPGLFEGTNATVFAYGTTGSGKTYTMQGTEDHPGIIPLAVATVLARCTGTWCSVEISYYEVYMERCYDLLEPKAKELMALDDKDGNLNLKGLCWVPVRSMEEFEELYSIGVQRRKVAHTGLNDISSRSHAVLSLRVCAASVKGKLNLVDLAGSEDNRRTMNEGIRLQESSKINQSLFALSKVFSALKRNELRIPYRESKLTRILQDSLGGRSCALMIACLNPAEYQEAINTLCVAARSCHIGNSMSLSSKPETPKGKVDMEAKLQSWLESKGKTKSIQRRNGLFSPTASKTPSSMNHMKQPASSRISGRVKTMDQDGIKIKKILFNPVNCIQNESLPKAGTQEDQNVNKAVLPSVSPRKEKMSETSPRRALSPISSHRILFNPTDCVQNENIPKAGTHESLNVNKAVLPSVSPCKEKKMSETSPRRALSPISSNVKRQISDTGNSPILLEPKTPLVTCNIAENENIPAATPLDKFNALGSALKETLVQHYLDVLNCANKEELQQLKGIGPRRAEYILELREDSRRPFKSLADLENIGLTSKQVQDILKKTASGIFK